MFELDYSVMTELDTELLELYDMQDSYYADFSVGFFNKKEEEKEKKNKWLGKAATALGMGGAAFLGGAIGAFLPPAVATMAFLNSDYGHLLTSLLNKKPTSTKNSTSSVPQSPPPPPREFSID